MSLFLHYYLYALNRALSISTHDPEDEEDLNRYIVSMPLIGLSPFLRRPRKIILLPLLMCQCP